MKSDSWAIKEEYVEKKLQWSTFANGWNNIENVPALK